MIEIKIDPDTEKQAHVERAGSIVDVELPVEIWVADGTELPQTEPSLSFSAFIWPFFHVLLDSLDDLENGAVVRFELEGRDLVAEPSGDGIRLAIDDYDPTQGKEQFGPRYEVPLKAFAAELIATADNFLADITDRRPMWRKSSSIHQLADTIEQARDWYRQQYGATPDSE